MQTRQKFTDLKHERVYCLYLGDGAFSQLALKGISMPTNVLIIDDDPFIHKVVRRALESHGFELNYALDGHTGIAAALDTKPDMILLDVEMPVLMVTKSVRS